MLLSSAPTLCTEEKPYTPIPCSYQGEPGTRYSVWDMQHTATDHTLGTYDTRVSFSSHHPLQSSLCLTQALSACLDTHVLIIW